MALADTRPLTSDLYHLITLSACNSASDDIGVRSRLSARPHHIVRTEYWLISSSGVKYHKMVHDSLINQHPVKGIPVQSRKPGQMQRGFFVKRKRINAMLLSQCGDKSYGRLRKRQLTQRMFDDDLPGRDRAKLDLIPRIYEQLPRVIGEIRSISHRPQERDRV